MTSNFGCFALLRVQSKRTLNISNGSSRVDRASAIETGDSGLIPGRANKRLKIGIHSFPA